MCTKYKKRAKLNVTVREHTYFGACDYARIKRTSIVTTYYEEGLHVTSPIVVSSSDSSYIYEPLAFL